MHAPETRQAPQAVVVAGGRVLNVFTGEVAPADVVIVDGRIEAVTPPGEADAVFASAGAAAASRPAGADGRRAPEVQVIDASDRVLVPGYVEPHAHLGLLAEPVQTLEQMAATGTTTVVADTYGLLAVLPDDELVHVLDRFAALPVCVRWFLAPHARSFLENEAELFRIQRLETLLARPDVIALGELTRWPDVAMGDPDLLAKIGLARRLGKRVEGHGAGASMPRLQRLVRHGVTSDHEAITADQVLDRLRAGLYTMLRHSSLRPDVPELVQALQGPLAFSNRIMFTADGPTPAWMARHGYLDGVVRAAVEAGLDPVAAYRMATLNPAMYYGLEWDVGSIAPGRRADLLILRDLTDPTPERVLAQGRLIAENGRLTGPLGRIPWARCRGMEKPPGAPPDSSVFAWPEAGAVPTLHMAHTVILRSGEGAGGDGQGDAAGRPAVQAVLYDWEGRWMTRALVTGFVDRLGGLASSYSPAFHLTVIGQRPEDMAAAAGRVLERGGGMCLVENGEVLWELPLERGGLFTETPWAELTARLQELERLMRERGYRHGELLYSMFFFGFDSLPDFRLTTRGVWDVRRRRVVAPPERLEQPAR
mgnify:CR=1 FL=1